MSVYIFSSGIALPLAVLPLAGSGKIPIGHRRGWLMFPLKGPAARPEIGESGVPPQGLWDFLLSTDEPGSDHLHTTTTTIFTKCSTISLEGTSTHLRRDTGSCCSGCVGSLTSQQSQRRSRLKTLFGISKGGAQGACALFGPP